MAESSQSLHYNSLPAEFVNAWVCQFLSGDPQACFLPHLKSLIYFQSQKLDLPQEFYNYETVT